LAETLSARLRVQTSRVSETREVWGARGGRLVTLAVVVVVAAVLAIVVSEPARAQAPGGGLAAWAYRRAILIDNTGNANGLVNQQVKVTLDAGNFDFASALPAGQDVRFVDADGVTPLDFWIERYDASARSAIAWVKVPRIPASSRQTIYLYYGNPLASAADSGRDTFEFFDDFGPQGPGYFKLSDAQTVLTQTQAWEHKPPHTLSVVEYQHDGYAYWGYYGAADCSGVGLARSNDLLHWDKYPGNPLYSQDGERWPTVLKVGDTFYMVHDRDYCTTSYLVLRTSKDGINFGGRMDFKVVVPREEGWRNQNPALFRDPKDGRYYLYWYHGDEKTLWQIKVRSAATPEGLADPASEQVVIEEPYTFAAPQMMVYDGTYYLATEMNENAWKTRVYAGPSPLGPFKRLPGNPLLADNEACFFQHIVGQTLHAYYCKDTGAGWVLNYRTADLSAGRAMVQPLDPHQWTPFDGTWTVGSGDAPDGVRSFVVNMATTGTQQLLSSYSARDYAVDVYGRRVSGPMWGLVVHAILDRKLYALTLFDNGDGSADLFVDFHETGTSNGASTPVGRVALGRFDLSQWHRLSVKLLGPVMDILVDDVPKLRVEGMQHDSGAIALYGEAGTRAQFAAVAIRKYTGFEPATIAGPQADARPDMTTALWLTAGIALVGVALWLVLRSRRVRRG
jgi:hypothetical protein